MTEARCPYCGEVYADLEHLMRCDGRQGQVEAQALEPPLDSRALGDLELLVRRASTAPDALRGMVHRDDPGTSMAAAAAVLRRRTELHAAVLRAFAERGPMTDEDLETLPEFDGYGPSTIRKRRSELYHQGALVDVGTRRNSRNREMLVFTIVAAEREHAS